MNRQLRTWLRISLISLLLVALAGLIMRYKIIYPLPVVDQKNLLHAHSHFAFAGWITQALMTLLVYYLYQRGDVNAFSRYRPLLWANIITAYGMLFTFPFLGYQFPSILFSTLSIFVSYWFAIQYWRDAGLAPNRNITTYWFRAAVVFNAVSSAGAFYLAYMLASKSAHTTHYLASVYFFLHFQYNGWFFFACMGLLSYRLLLSGVAATKIRQVFLLFVVACVPAYFLSALWLPIGKFIYIMVVVAALLQLVGWGVLMREAVRLFPVIRKQVTVFAGVLFVFFAVALSIKLLLQAASVIPSLSRYAFGFRPIIIGYLHLVLLGVITVFLLAYIAAYRLIPLTAAVRWGIILFTAGIISNELLLMMQGIADMRYEPLPAVNKWLLGAALMLFSGMLLVNGGLLFSKYDRAHNSDAGN